MENQLNRSLLVSKQKCIYQSCICHGFKSNRWKNNSKLFFTKC